MNSEIKRLEMRIKLGSGDEELDLVQCAALRDLMNAYESQIATLAAERDEARKEVERLTDNLKVSRLFVDGVSKHLECGATLENSGNWSSYCETVANNYMLRMTEACKLRDSLAAELAALKSAPGMEEVDAMERELLDEIPSWSQRTTIELLANLARRSIAAREEVVGMLKHILSCIITVKQENTPEWMEYIAEEVNRINEATGDPDRVSLRFGGIVIVKGDSEIVEGK